MMRMYQVKNVVEKGLQLKGVPVDDEDVSSALWYENNALSYYFNIS